MEPVQAESIIRSVSLYKKVLHIGAHVFFPPFSEYHFLVKRDSCLCFIVCEYNVMTLFVRLSKQNKKAVTF